MMFHALHTDAQTPIPRPNWLRPNAGAAGAGEARESGAEGGRPAADAPGVGQERLLQALHDTPAVRAEAVAAARTELASGRLLTRAAAREAASALLRDAIPELK